MRVNLVISENCCIFIVLNYKVLQTIIAMITESKVIELFCMADDFCKFFDAMMAKYTFKPTAKRKYHRDSTMSKAEIMLIMRPSRWPYSSRRYFWANVQASVLLTALLYGYARTKESIFIKRSRE